MVKPRIIFWYTDDKELESLLKLREFRKANLTTKHEYETWMEYDYHDLQAFKTDKILMNQRALKCAEVLLSKSFYDKISADEIYDFFHPMLAWGVLGNSNVECIDFQSDDSGNVWIEEIFVVNREQMILDKKIIK